VPLPVLRPGLVIRYGFLWSHEKAAGALDAAKDRPCAVVMAVRTEGGEIKVTVAPVTHRPPDDPTASIELPASICRELGLDENTQWLRLDELNRFIWPGYDIRPLPGHPGKFDYGMLPKALYEELRQGILARQKAGQRITLASRD
jgi:hypothetical protein